MIRGRRRAGSSRPRFEGLESRVALAMADSPAGAAAIVAAAVAPPLTAGLAVPTSGSTLTTLPPSLTIEFNRPIATDPADAASQVVIALTDASGMPTSTYFSPDLSIHAPQLDPSGRLLTVWFDPQAVPVGHYGVYIQDSIIIADADGVPLNYDYGLGYEVVGVLSIAPPPAQPSPAKVTDLGTPGSTPGSVPGTLDLLDNPLAVDLYRIELPAGHHWRLGLEVTARAGDPAIVAQPLISALTLFDASGRSISSFDGASLASGDPYLFAGLAPGTYYVGVSGTRNLPATIGGPAVSNGQDVPSQPGGPYDLAAVADPEDRPPRLVSFSLDHADPNSSTPTGLTLGFSDALNLGRAGGLSQSLDAAIEVVDAGGRAWPVIATGYREALGSVSYQFRDPLPAGRYTVLLPSSGGLVDLAGLAPVAAHLPAGQLATFDVAPSNPPGPGDLGAILADAALAGVPADLLVGAGQSTSVRMAITIPGLYTIPAQADGSGLAIRLDGPGGTMPIAASSPGDAGGPIVHDLQAGVYVFSLTDAGPGPIHVRLIVDLPAIDQDQILANGIGQGPALDLRLIAPTAIGPLDNVATPAPSSSDPRAVTSTTTPASGPTALLISSVRSISGDTPASPGFGASPTVMIAPTATIYAGPVIAAGYPGTGDLVGRPSSSASRSIGLGPDPGGPGFFRGLADAAGPDDPGALTVSAGPPDRGEAFPTAPEGERAAVPRGPALVDRAFSARFGTIVRPVRRTPADIPAGDPGTVPTSALLDAFLQDEADPEPEADEPRTVAISPAAVVVSVALLAQIGQRAARWLGGKSRRRRGRAGAWAR